MFVRGLLVGALVLGVAYAWSAQYWLDMVDEGYFLELAARVYHGQVPYRDFDTYYTPGIFYLFATVFHAFGVSVMPIRLLMAVVRTLCLVLVARLTMRCTQWPFAVLAALVVAALDHWPIEPEPHPSWPALAAFLLTMDLVAAHHADGRRRWLVLAGATAAVACLFKQNVGAFATLGLVGYVILRRSGGWQLQTLRMAFAVVLGGAVLALLWPALDARTALTLWLPVLLILGVLTFRTPAPHTERIGPVFGELTLVAVPFAVVSAAWLVPLGIALLPATLPVALFLGAVNQVGLASPFPDLSPGARLLLLVSLGALASMAIRAKRWPYVAAAAVAAILIALAPIADTPQPTLTTDERLIDPLGWLNDQFGTLHLYLPALAAWAALAALLLTGRAGMAGPMRWFVLFGTLGALALYPRLDTPHVIVASPAILVAGAWALSRLYAALTGHHRAIWSAVAACVVVAIPIAAVAPQVLWRYATLTYPPRNPPSAAYAPLALERAPMLLPSQTADDVRATVRYVEAGTPPGAPLFTYPAAPLFNFLADRPNPSRFDHFLPGALTAADLDQVIDDIDAVRPRYVVWDHGGVIYWGTDPANRVLSDYIWRCYELAVAFDFYLVLERREC